MQTPIRRPPPFRPESAYRRPMPRTAPRFLRFIPRSTAINFIALILLGGLVFALQSFGRKGDPAAAAPQPAAPAAVAAAPEVKLEAAAAPMAAAAPATMAAPAAAAPVTAPTAAPVTTPTTPEAQRAMAALPPTTLPAPTTAPAVEPPASEAPAAAPAADPAPAPAVYTLKNPASEGTAEKPRVDASKTAAARTRATASSRTRYAEDRSVAVEELDGEGARQAYLRQTSGMPSATAPRDELSTSSRPQPQARRAPADDLAMEGDSYRRSPAALPPSELKRGSRTIEDDLDGEVARLNYLKQNGSAAGNATASGRKGAAVPPEGGSPRSFIPYEQ